MVRLQHGQINLPVRFGASLEIRYSAYVHLRFVRMSFGIGEARGLLSIFQSFGSWLGGQTTVKRLNPNNSDEMSAVVDLFERRIDPSQQVETSLFVQWLEDPVIRSQLRNTVFIAKYRGQVVGFLQLMMPGKHRYAFASYFAVDDTSIFGRVHAAERLAWAAMMFVDGSGHAKDTMVFEVEMPKPAQNKELAKINFARIRRFRNLFTRFGYRAYEVEAPYVMPDLPNDRGESISHEMRLLYVTNTMLIEHAIAKAEYAEILGFIYEEIYSRVYDGDRELKEIYDKELSNTKADLLRRCQDKITLI